MYVVLSHLRPLAVWPRSHLLFVLRIGACLALAGYAAAADYRILPNVQKIRKHHYSTIACSPDGRFVAAAGGKSSNALEPGKVTIWDIHSGEIVLNRLDFPCLCQVVRFSPDSGTLAVVSGDRAARRVFVYTLTLTRAGKRQVWGEPVRLDWPASSGPSRIDGYETYSPGDISFSPSGNGIAHLQSMYRVGSRLNTTRNDPPRLLLINCWRDRGDDLQFELPGTDHSGVVRFLDENRLILDSWRGTQSARAMHLLQVVDLTTGTLQREVPFAADRGAIHVTNGVELSADRKWIAHSYLDGVRVLQAADLEEVSNITTGKHESISLSPSGDVLATSFTSGDWWVRFFDVQTGEEIASRSNGAGYYPSDIEFSLDGRYLATLDVDGGIRLWDMQQILPGRNLAAAGNAE